MTKIRVLSLGVAVMALLFQSSCSALTLLGRKSTATQVYKYLDQNNQLAPYVTQGGTALVTGGNSGVGAETVKTLVQSGMNVILCARNMNSANALKESLSEEQQDRVDIQYMDLSDLTSVKLAADDILKKYKTIDACIFNAGIMALPQRETSIDDIELQWGTNHVAHHYLARLLLPQINPKGRMVTVASTAHAMAGSPIDDWQSSEKYSPWGAYGKSKLSNILFAKQLQKELKKNSGSSSEISSVSLHPGVIASPLWKHALPKLLQPVAKLIANKNVEQGAATSIYCALCRKVEDGAYYDDCAVTEPKPTANDATLQQNLWDYTEALLAEKGFKLPALDVAESSVVQS